MRETERTTKTVYGLADPRDMVVKYVGSSINPEHRVNGHMGHTEMHNNPKRQWLEGLREAGMKPLLIRFGELPHDLANHVEAQIIEAVSQAGYLTNRVRSRNSIQPSDGTPEWRRARDLATAMLELAEGAMS